MAAITTPMSSDAELEHHLDEMCMEPESSFNDNNLDDPWEWLSDDEDEETRNYVAWFEAEVEDAYKSQEKIKGCSVDMDWCARMESLAASSKEKELRLQRSIYVVDTAASLGHPVEDVTDDSEEKAAAKAQFAEVAKAPLTPAPPSAPRATKGSGRPSKRRLHSSNSDDAAANTQSGAAAPAEEAKNELGATPSAHFMAGSPANALRKVAARA